MQKQHRQYVILVVVLLACAASVFFGIRSILHSNDEVTTFAVGDWEGITLPRYYGPTVYPTSQRLMATVTLPMTSTSTQRTESIRHRTNMCAHQVQELEPEETQQQEQRPIRLLPLQPITSPILRLRSQVCARVRWRTIIYMATTQQLPPLSSLTLLHLRVHHVQKDCED